MNNPNSATITYSYSVSGLQAKDFILSLSDIKVTCRPYDKRLQEELKKKYGFLFSQNQGRRFMKSRS